jgi:AAA domain
MQVMIDHSRRPLTLRDIVNEVAHIRRTEQATGDNVTIRASSAGASINIGAGHLPKPRDVNDILRDHGPDAVRDAVDRAEDLKTNSRDSKRGGPDSKADAWRERLINPQELFDRRFDELKYVVPGIIPEGVTLLVSRPKLGKSWLLLQVCTAISTGVVTLVASDDPPCGDALYLSLEDNPRRVQRRLTKYFGVQKESWPTRLTLAVTWRRLDQGGVDDLRAWCGSVPKPTLIAIDTLKKVRPPKRNNQSDYDADYEACEGLKKLVDEFPGLSIIVAHHDRKMDAEDVFDTVSGTLGLTGGVDTIAILKRTSKAVTLHIEGRDLVDQIEKAVSFDRDTCRWCILGEAAEIQRSGERSRVLAALADPTDGLTVSEIQAAAQLGTRGAADMLLSRMARDGEVARINRGRFSLPQYACEKREIDKEYGGNPHKTHTPAHTPGSNASNAESEKHHTPAPPSHTSALEFLTWALQPGRRLVRDIEASARAEGLLGERQRIDNAKTFQDAKSVLKVVVEREGFGPGSKVYWKLPDIDSRQDAHSDGHATTQATPTREPEGGQ